VTLCRATSLGDQSMPLIFVQISWSTVALHRHLKLNALAEVVWEEPTDQGCYYADDQFTIESVG
jgi:hypothetical protein